MSLTLQLADVDGNLLSESYALLDQELLDYLALLEGFPVFRSFRGVDPADETYLDEEVRIALAVEAEVLAERVERREVPEPPEHVGLEGLGDLRLGEDFGWGGLRDFLLRVSHLLHLARTLGMEVWLVGED
jgi:hypothetical protein